jgi:hypothetical protein
MPTFISVPVGTATWYINLDLVRSIQPTSDGGSSLKFDDQHSLPVKMPTDAIAGAIGQGCAR